MVIFRKNVKYITDRGYLLSRKAIEYFHRYYSMKADFNLIEGASYFHF